MRLPMFQTKQNPARLHRHIIRGRDGRTGRNHGRQSRRGPSKSSRVHCRQRWTRTRASSGTSRPYFPILIRSKALRNMLIDNGTLDSRVPGLIFESLLFIGVAVRFIRTRLEGRISSTPLLRGPARSGVHERLCCEGRVVGGR